MLVVILVSLSAFGFEIDAKKSLNNNFDRSDRLIDRNQRDDQDFINQIYDASSLNSLCNLRSCASLANPSVCPGFCKENTDLMIQAMTAAAKCLSTVPCSQSRQENKVKEIPLAVEGYEGVCSLSGNVTVSGKNDVILNNPKLYGFSIQSLPMNSISLAFTLTYSDLSVTCSSLSDHLNLFNKGIDLCAGDGGSSGSKFTANVTVTQSYTFDLINVFFNNLSDPTECSVTTSAHLVSGVPAAYKKQVETAVELQLDNFDFVNGICRNYAFNMGRALRNIYDTNCPKSNCTAA